METDLKAAMTAGVMIEFFDAQGNCVAQSVFADWCGRPLPAPGDLLTTEVHCTSSRGKRKVVGRVRERHFDVQQTDEGDASVWARLTVDVVNAAPPAHPAPHPGRFAFSQN